MKRTFHPSRRLVYGAAFVAIASSALVGCSRESITPLSPLTSAPTQSSPAAQPQVLTFDNPSVRGVMEVQDRHTAALLRNPNIIGTATGLDESGQVAVLVLTVRPLGAGVLPATLDGVPVVEEVTGVIRPLDSGANHKVKQTPPVQLGTSGGWRFDLANGYCCGGTLGSLVSKGGQNYVLSNYHVLEADIASGGNGRVAQAGDAVIQPALIDVSCNANNAQNVATLSGIKSLPGSNVDAAIAQIVSGMVRTDGSILDIGTIGASPIAASLNQTVKKSGRTSGLTRSSVSGLNATVSVSYDNECAGGAAFTKTFTGQILIKGRSKGQTFLAGGDSGSLMVQDVTSNPRPVGLLFAGSSTTAVANPIGEVLSFLGATMVGN